MEERIRRIYLLFLWLFPCGFSFSIYGEIVQEIVTAPTDLYPLLAQRREIPYLTLSGEFSAGTTLSLQGELYTGPLYLDGKKNPSYYRKRYFLHTLYGQGRFSPFTGKVGILPQKVGEGRITQAENPGVEGIFRIRKGVYGTVGIYQAVTEGILPTSSTPRGGYIFLSGKTTISLFLLGVHIFYDPSGELASLFNPFWPLVWYRIHQRDPRLALQILPLLEEKNAFLSGSRSTLTTPYLKWEQYIGSFLWKGMVLWQTGSSHLTTLLQREETLAHQGYGLDSTLSFFAEKGELSLQFLYLSGDSSPLDSTFTTFIGIQSQWNDTPLFFGGGIHPDFQGPLFQTPGIMGMGVKGGIVRGTLYPFPEGEISLYIGSLFRERKVPSLKGDHYGEEIGMEGRYTPIPHLYLGFLFSTFLPGNAEILGQEFQKVRMKSARLASLFLSYLWE
jgi:hypothetical protein